MRYEGYSQAKTPNAILQCVICYVTIITPSVFCVFREVEVARVSAQEKDWFELIDELVSTGASPTVRTVAALARKRFGVAASFTTIQAVLDSWRRLGGAVRPKNDTTALAAAIQKVVDPLYQQLVTSAREEFEPLLVKAEERADSAETERDRLRDQLRDLKTNHDHVTAELHAAIKRHEESKADFRARIEALEAHNNLLLKVRGEDNARYSAILNTIESLKVKGT
jgi:hypothetical protein